jgi:hypothetical protein
MSIFSIYTNNLHFVFTLLCFFLFPVRFTYFLFSLFIYYLLNGMWRISDIISRIFQHIPYDSGHDAAHFDLGTGGRGVLEEGGTGGRGYLQLDAGDAVHAAAGPQFGQDEGSLPTNRTVRDQVCSTGNHLSMIKSSRIL